MGEQQRHEAPEIGGMVRRMMRALVRRAAEGDTEALEQLASLTDESRYAQTAAIILMQSGERMAGDGYSFGHLAGVLGVTRQATRQVAVYGGGHGGVRYYLER